MNETNGWQPIATAPKDEMFIWAYWSENKLKWLIGLAYRNVSGGFSDAYGDSNAPSKATYWHSMPTPPVQP